MPHAEGGPRARTHCDRQVLHVAVRSRPRWATPARERALRGGSYRSDAPAVRGSISPSGLPYEAPGNGHPLHTVADGCPPPSGPLQPYPSRGANCPTSGSGKPARRRRAGHSLNSRQNAVRGTGHLRGVLPSPRHSDHRVTGANEPWRRSGAHPDPQSAPRYRRWCGPPWYPRAPLGQDQPER